MVLFNPGLSTRSKPLIANNAKTAAKPTELTPIRSASTLLRQATRQTWLKKIQALFSAKMYQALYQPAVEQLARYVQGLPANQQGPFSSAGGLLDHGLSRASYALSLYIEHFSPNTPHFRQLTDPDPQALALYALFTAALLLDIGHLCAQYSITLCNQAYQPIQQWQPFTGPMDSQNAVYYKFQMDQQDRHSRSLGGGCLAACLLEKGTRTQKGFHWIASDYETLESWLAVMAGEDHRIPVQEIMTLMPFADKAALDQQRLQVLNELSRRKKTSIFYANQATDGTLSSQNWNLAEQFLQWLRERIAARKVPINTTDIAGIRRVENGVLIARALLEQFSQLHQLDAQMVERQFHEVMALYPSSVNERGRQSSQLGGVAQAALGQWLLAHNPALLFSMGKLPPFYLLDSLGVLPTSHNQPKNF